MRRSWATFVLVFFAIVGTGCFYVGVRLAENAFQWTFLLAMGASILSMPLVFWRTSLRPDFRGREVLQQATYVSMGLLSWLFVVTLGRDLALLVAFLLAPPSTVLHWAELTGGYPAFFLAVAITAFGSWRALRGPRIRNISIPIANLPTHLEGMRIAQISDLHIGPTIGHSYVDKLVGTIEALSPDFTVLTGDIFDGSVATLGADVDPLKRLSEGGRVFFVPGNHEYYHQFEGWIPKLAELGATVLLNRGETVTHGTGSLWVGGVTDPAAAQMRLGEAPSAAKAASGGEASPFRVLLSHRPDTAHDAARAGFHLQLSGHTHGGQFFPWTLVAKMFHEHFLGLMRLENLWLYVSPGSGSWGPPIRLGTTPEITCLKIERAA